MNKTPKLRFKEFSGDWKPAVLDNIAEITMGQSPIGESYNLEKEGIGLINGPVEFTNKYPVVVQYTTKPTKYCYDGDILFCVRGSSIGRMNISDNTYCIGRGVASIKARKNKSITNYIYLLLQNKLENILGFANGSTFPNISSTELKRSNIYAPKLEEQEKIASFFSLIDDKISLQGEKVEALKDYKTGMMQKIFSRELRFKDDDGRDYPEWEEKKLSELVMFTNGKAHENCIDEFGDYVVVNSKFISSDGNVAKLSNENLCPLKKDDIVMVMSDVPNGKALAKCYLIDKDNRYTLNQRICGLRSTGADYKFLYYSINRNKYYLKFDNGVGQTNLRKDEVLECPILLPCRAEQEKIGSLLFDLDIKLEKEQEKLDSLNEYKKGLLQQMFV